MKTNLGKVAITPKGTWNSTTVYTALDTVNFGGGSWLAKRGNIAVTPTEGDDWMQLSAKGADAELTKDSIVSALGYTPERDYGNYELIETITLTEDTAEIIRTQEPDGTAYKFKKLSIYIAGKCAAASNGAVLFRSTGNTLLLSAPIAKNTSSGTVFLRTEIANGMVLSTSSNTIGGSGNISALYSARFPVQYGWGDNIITNVVIQCSDLIVSGSVITIYAVRS